MTVLSFTPRARDGFTLAPNSALHAEHALLDEYIAEVLGRESWAFFSARLSDTAVGTRLAALESAAAVRVVLALVERLVLLSPYSNGGGKPQQARDGFERALRGLLMRRLPFTEAALCAVLDWLLAEPPMWRRASLFPYVALAKAIQTYAEVTPVSNQMNERVQSLARQLEASWDRETRKAAARLLAAGGRGPELKVAPGEAWSDSVIAHVAAQPAAGSAAWQELLEHCGQASGGKPSAKWIKRASELLATLGADEFRRAVLAWFPLVDKPRTAPIEQWPQWGPNPNLLVDERNSDTLKGLVWCCGADGNAGFADALAKLAVSTYRKVPGVGPRATKIGNACVNTLGDLHEDTALAALAVLKVRVKFGTAQKGIDKALDAAAARAGLTRDELEEIGVPTYGLEAVGIRREALDGGHAELLVVGTAKAELGWVGESGTRQKSIPKAVNRQHAEALKALKVAARDIEKMLAAQGARLESLFLARREWPLRDWRARYLDHPLVGTLARRLIWEFRQSERRSSGCWHEGKLVDRAGTPLDWLTPSTQVRLWHPALDETQAIVEWRAWFEAHEIAQPFKQAHREIYLLTDAERATRVYSNRFAAHVLKQHQFNALCAARGWRNKLRLLVDDEYPPATMDLAAWNLRAEFWVEGAGTGYGTDTNESGTFLYLTTDQVRFYPLQAAANSAHASGGGYGQLRAGAGDNPPVPLEEIPLLVLSEVLRDVDLFVGVASVSSDPTWSDGGPDGRYREYWHANGFGELSESAATRRATLERLLPRLKISSRCSLTDRFLVVRGKLRTYKIHLGSANVLMEPNDQYLCIVPAQSQSKGRVVFLPFEGDTRLTVVLSKAFLLAEDDQIEDATIVRQIAG